MTKTPTAPAHLRPETREWWTTIASQWDLLSHHLTLLTLAAEALDRAAEAREAIARDGAYSTSSGGVVRRHPALVVERDSVITHARVMRELALEGAPAPDIRPPRVGGSR